MIAVFTALGVGFYLYFRNRNRRGTTSDEQTEPKRGELDGGIVAKELEVQREKAELEKTDYMKWELPTTPPTDRSELPAEVPVVELEAATDQADSEQGVSENGTTEVGNEDKEDMTPKVSPLISREGRDSFQTPASIRSSTNTAGRSRFEEALYDLISDELRRPDTKDEWTRSHQKQKEDSC